MDSGSIYRSNTSATYKNSHSELEIINEGVKLHKKNTNFKAQIGHKKAKSTFSIKRQCGQHFRYSTVQLFIFMGLFKK